MTILKIGIRGQENPLEIKAEQAEDIFQKMLKDLKSQMGKWIIYHDNNGQIMIRIEDIVYITYNDNPTKFGYDPFK